jgi:hypothetical protein
MNELTITAAPSIVPFIAAGVLRDKYEEAVWIDEDLIRVDSNGKLLCLDEAKTEAARWQLGDSARHALRTYLPTLADVRPVLAALDLELDTEPSIEQRVDLVGAMLDIQGLTPDLKYIRYLAGKLGNCPARKSEAYKRRKPWFCREAIARALDEVLSEMRPEGGRPIPVADVLDVVGKHSSEIMSLRRQIVTINNTICRLQTIAEATKDAKEPVFQPLTDDWAEEQIGP